MTEEPEVITFKEVFERNKNIPFEELCKMVLECKNCGHKDLLKNFIKKKKPDWDIISPKPDQVPYPYKPKPLPNPWKRYRWQKNKKKLSALWINNTEYEDLFYCPKCGSSLVVLCKDFVKNNILRGLNNG